MLLPVFLWGHAVMGFEDAVKKAGILIADLADDFFHRQLGLLQQIRGLAQFLFF